MGVVRPARQHARPGLRPDLGIRDELAAADLIVLAYKGYNGAGDPVLPPYRGRNKPASQKQADPAHARLRVPDERVNAPSSRHGTSWASCPAALGARQLAKAIHVLQTREIGDKKAPRIDENLTFIALNRAKPGWLFLKSADAS